jgi:hypothetical protein
LDSFTIIVAQNITTTPQKIKTLLVWLSAIVLFLTRNWCFFDNNKCRLYLKYEQRFDSVALKLKIHTVAELRQISLSIVPPREEKKTEREENQVFSSFSAWMKFILSASRQSLY